LIEISRRLFVKVKELRIGDSIKVDLVASQLKVSVDEIMSSGKWIVDNGHDRMSSFCLEFSNDYTEIVKKQSYDNIIKEQYYEKRDNKKNNATNRGRKL